MSARVLRIALVLTFAALLAGCGGQAKSGNLDDLLAQGWSAYSMGNFDAAHGTFERVLQDGRVSLDQTYSAVLGLAVSFQYQSKPDLDKALEYYKRLGELKVQSAVPQSMLGIGSVQLQQGKTKEGQLELTNLAQRFPKTEEANEAVVQLADSRFRPTPDEKAPGGYRMATAASTQLGIEVLEQRLKAYPDNPLAAVMHMMVGSKLVDQGLYKRAVPHLEAALKLGVESSTIAASLTWQVARIADLKLHDYALADKYYAEYAAKNRKSQLYYRAVLSQQRMKSLLAKEAKSE